MSAAQKSALIFSIPYKHKPEECALIPEVQDSPALKNALIALNAPETPFFTVGCEKSGNL